jgi:hypothetical protein
MQPVCSSCYRPIKREATICVCGAPTQFMSFAERTAYELEQWRVYKERVRSA